jgi:hypothetical protein
MVVTSQSTCCPAQFIVGMVERPDRPSLFGSARWMPTNLRGIATADGVDSFRSASLTPLPCSRTARPWQTQRHHHRECGRFGPTETSLGCLRSPRTAILEAA